MADHPSPCARQQHSGDCELETTGGRGRDWRSRAIAQRLSPRGHDDSSARHRRRPRGLHPLRPLHARLRRHQEQHGARRARGKGYRPDRLRPRPADGQLDLRVVRRVHGVVPDRRAHQQARGRHRARRRRRPRRRSELLQLPVFQGRLGHVPGAEPGRGREAHVPRRAKSSAAKASSDPPLSTFSKARSRSSSPRPMRTSRQEGSSQAASSARFAEHARPAAIEHRAQRRERPPLHPDRRAVDLPYDKPIAELGRRRPVRRDDLHELLSALGDGAREDRLSSCWRCCATCSTSCRRTRRSAHSSNATTARARSTHTCAACRCFAVADEGLHRSPARPGGTDPLLRPGEVICRQGDAADSFYLVRIGFVKVVGRASRRRTRAHLLARGGLLRRDRRCSAEACAPRPAPRSTTSRSSASPATIST